MPSLQKEFVCPYECPFVELETRVCRDERTDSRIASKPVEELKEMCAEKRINISHQYGIEVPCGYVGELVVKQVIGRDI